jgi:hypothetical protein
MKTAAHDSTVFAAAAVVALEAAADLLASIGINLGVHCSSREVSEYLQQLPGLHDHESGNAVIMAAAQQELTTSDVYERAASNAAFHEAISLRRRSAPDGLVLAAQLRTAAIGTQLLDKPARVLKSAESFDARALEVLAERQQCHPSLLSHLASNDISVAEAIQLARDILR